MNETNAADINFESIMVHDRTVIVGDAGSGKTRTLQRIEDKLRDDGLKVRMTTAEEFSNELVRCIRGQKMEEFREKFRNVDALLLDDFEMIRDRERTQEEVFYTADALEKRGGKLILTCISTHHEKLLDRLAWRLNSAYKIDLKPRNH